MSTEPEKEKKRFPSFPNPIAFVKESLGVLRELLIVLVLALLLLWPGAINNRLQGAGFVEADVAGFKWKSAQQAVQKTGEAQQQVEEVKEETEETIKKVDELAAKVNNPEVKKELERLKSSLHDSLDTAKAAETTLQSTRQVQENILQAIQPDAAATVGAWGVVISADDDLNEAQHEVNRAKGQGYTSVFIYQKGKLLRTIIEFPSSADAQEALSNVRAKIRNDAFAVNLDEWCSNRTPAGDNAYRCGDAAQLLTR